jgi:hypothetical protein
MRDLDSSFDKGQTNASGNVICGAKTRNGTPCKSTAVMANGRCRMHGGKSKAGADSPRFKTGRYSKYLPDNLLWRYREGLADPELQSLRDELAMLNVRITQVIEHLSTGEGRSAWDAVREAFDALRGGFRQNNLDAIREGMAGIEAALDQAKDEQGAWDEIVALFDERRKLVGEEGRREERAQRYITEREIMVLMAALVDVVRTNVSNQDEVTAVSMAIRQLVSGTERSMN